MLKIVDARSGLQIHPGSRIPYADHLELVHASEGFTYCDFAVRDHARQGEFVVRGPIRHFDPRFKRLGWRVAIFPS